MNILSASNRFQGMVDTMTDIREEQLIRENETLKEKVAVLEGQIDAARNA